MMRTTGPGTPTRVRLGCVGFAIALVVTVVWGLAASASRERVLHRVVAPGGGVVAVCREEAGFDGGYTMRLERPGAGDTRTLYTIGDGDPCSEVVWSPNGQILAVLSKHVGRVRFVDVEWAMAHPEIQTASWSWRQVDLSTDRWRVRGSGLRFVGPQSVEIQTCSVDPVGACFGASTRRFDIPVPVVTGHVIVRPEAAADIDAAYSRYGRAGTGLAEESLAAVREGSGGAAMMPRMTTCGTFAVLGVACRIRRGSESPGLFGRIWKTFESRRHEIESAATQKVYFGVSFPTDEEGVTEYLAGMMVGAGTPPPEGLEARTVSGGQYAVFECPVDAIGATYQHVFGVWLPGAAVEFDAGRAPFEEYPENTPEQPVRLHIPVRPQPAGGEGAGLGSAL